MRTTFPIIGCLVLILSACTGMDRSPGVSSSLHHSPSPDALTVGMEFRVLHEERGTRTMGIIVTNPRGVPIQSVRSWVRFDPVTVHVQNLTIADARFVLFAPGERSIDRTEGFVKIGGATREAIHDAEILVATFTVRVPERTGEVPVLAFYDWRAEGDGHTAVLSLAHGGVVNLLRPPLSIAL